MRRTTSTRLFISLLFISLIFASITHAHTPYKAITIVPIADLVGSPIQTFFPESSPEDCYANLVLCGGTPAAYAYCPRLHQLLFNEMGTVTEECDEEVLISISSCFYVPKNSLTPQHSYWTLKKNIITLEELEQEKVPVDLFPPSLSFDNPDSVVNEQVVTLALPWHDTITDQLFSAGTRFLKAQQEHNNDAISVYVFNPITKAFVTSLIPQSILIMDLPSQVSEKISLFVQVLKKWASLDHGSITYVLGGSSFIATTNNSATEKHIFYQDTPCTYYERDDFNQNPKSGFDCSNLITRAAQMAGIPFFFKNSLTIVTCLKQFDGDQKLETGDIIWKPGHVMVISDREKNTVIEARGYPNGVGKVHEIALNKAFENIKTCEDLVAAWHNNQPIYRLGSDGSVIDEITGFKLLSLRSIFLSHTE